MLTPADIFWTAAAFAFAFGAIIGSFLNVVIYRVPAGQSIVSPGSRCPSCGEAVRWYDNIPIVSWFLLRGRCRSCGAAFSLRYALIEALTGVIALAAWWQAAGGLLRIEELPDPNIIGALAVVFALKFAFLCFLVAITFIDLDTFLIPHAISIPGIVLGLASPWITRAVLGIDAVRVVWPPVSPLMSIVGALVGFVGVIAIFYGYFAVRGRPGMGGGDATLMALVGAWLGWPALVFVLFAASLQGVLASALSHFLGGGMISDSEVLFADDEELAAQQRLARAREADGVAPEQEELPFERMAVAFGPFICLAALEFALLGPFMPAELSMIYLY